MYYKLEQTNECTEVVRSRLLTVKEGGIQIQKGKGKEYFLCGYTEFGWRYQFESITSEIGIFACLCMCLCRCAFIYVNDKYIYICIVDI